MKLQKILFKWLMHYFARRQKNKFPMNIDRYISLQQTFETNFKGLKYSIQRLPNGDEKNKFLEEFKKYHTFVTELIDWLESQNVETVKRCRDEIWEREELQIVINRMKKTLTKAYKANEQP